MANTFPYKSVHDYLKMEFGQNLPSDAVIQVAKKKYWKLYNLHLKRRSRSQSKHLTIKLTPAQYKLVHQQAKSNGVGVSQFCTALLCDTGLVPFESEQLVSNIQQVVLSFLDALSDVIEGSAIDPKVHELITSFNSEFQTILLQSKIYSEDDH